MQDTISRSQLIAGLAGLEPEARLRIEGMLGSMGIKVPVKHKSSGYKHSPKPTAPKEYWLHWHITCELCKSEENRFFHMIQDKELNCLRADVVENPAEYTLINWKTEHKKRATCPACIQYLESQPHDIVCIMVVEARRITLPIY